jgi:hypothetical protein
MAWSSSTTSICSFVFLGDICVRDYMRWARIEKSRKIGSDWWSEVRPKCQRGREHAVWATAPKARDMIARGKCEARRPWSVPPNRRRGLKGRNNRRRITPLQGWSLVCFLTRGDALRACPWLSYFAPSALGNRARKWRAELRTRTAWMANYLNRTLCM